jgi:hypothetical protein
MADWFQESGIRVLLRSLVKIRDGYREDIERWRKAEADVDALIAATRAAFPEATDPPSRSESR